MTNSTNWAMQASPKKDDYEVWACILNMLMNLRSQLHFFNKTNYSIWIKVKGQNTCGSSGTWGPTEPTEKEKMSTPLQH